ncbi:hypothetical protein [Roseateles sp.]|uniref:hypothetical protein n=1 Tax=Roseateles sp. TaxID=1971397 RepID=UPI0039EC59EC
MSWFQRALHFIKVTAVFAVCWLIGALVVAAFTEQGPLRMPLATVAAFLACVGLFAVQRPRPRLGRPDASRPAGTSAEPRRSSASDDGHAVIAGAGLGALGALSAQAFASPTHDASPAWNDTFDSNSSLPVINPATGLPMVGDSIGGVDVGGNLYGTQSSDMFGSDHAFGSDTFASHSFSSDDFNSGISSGSNLDSW